METIRSRGWGEGGSTSSGTQKDVELRFLTLEEVAAYCGVPFFEVRSWISSGRLRATLLESGRYRIGAQDFLAHLYRMLAAMERERD